MLVSLDLVVDMHDGLYRVVNRIIERLVDSRWISLSIELNRYMLG